MDIIPQLDGHNSFTSSVDSTNSSFSTSILSNSSNESFLQSNEAFNSMPRILATNARSIFPKYVDLIEHLQMHRIDFAQISETWQDTSCKDHNDKISELENKYGYKWLGCSRPKYKEDNSRGGGGGSAVLVNMRHFNADVIEGISVPKNLELVWVKIVPKFKCSFKVFIVCGIYSKPNSKTKTIMNNKKIILYKPIHKPNQISSNINS